jgi:uncharacterized Zn finger protein
MPDRPTNPPRYATRPAKPRRVRGGVRVSPTTAAASWASRLWMTLVESSADPADLAEGIEYARLGQSKSFEIIPGGARAPIQGRADRPYDTRLRFREIEAEAWEQIARTMTEQARYAAKLLAGELPREVEDLFTRLGHRLVPSEEQDIQPGCTCNSPGARRGWCKHACCLAYLLADRIARDPMVLFTLRGMPADDFMERLRHNRNILGAGDGSTPVYSPVVRGASDVPSTPLEECLDGFWRPAQDAAEPDLPVDPPQVSHPLLRRLGPSPFKEGQFPLVGLLATCYEVISERTIRQELGESDAAK